MSFCPFTKHILHSHPPSNLHGSTHQVQTGFTTKSEVEIRFTVSLLFTSVERLGKNFTLL